MQIEEIELNKIKPYEKNSRIHSEEQVYQLAKSIKEFGFNQPIVIDDKNIVLVGHGRLLAAQQLKLKKVPCIKLKKLSEVQKKAYRILDNKLASDSTWFFDNLENELKFLDENEFDLKEWKLDSLNSIFQENDSEQEWDETLPDFQSENLSKLQIVVHFETEKAREDFAKLIDQKLTPKTRSIHFPYKENDNLKANVYVNQTDA